MLITTEKGPNVALYFVREVHSTCLLRYYFSFVLCASQAFSLQDVLEPNKNQNLQVCLYQTWKSILCTDCRLLPLIQ